MPKKYLNPYHLKLLKALICFKIKGHYFIPLTIQDRLDIERTSILSGRTLDRFFGEGKDASGNLKETSLNELCSLFIKQYTWNNFVLENPAPFDELVPNQLFIDLTESWQKRIIQSIDNKLKDYSSYENYLSGIPRIKTELRNNYQISSGDIEIKQFAKRIYIELITRKAAIPIDFEKDVIEEIYNSWYNLFCIIRDEIKKLPILEYDVPQNSNNPIEFALKILNEILRPHLTEHQAKYRSWLENEKKKEKVNNFSPQELQKNYPNYKSISKSMQTVNSQLIQSAQIFYDFSL